MSTAYAIAAVTKILHGLLEQSLAATTLGGTVTVTVDAPDRVKLDGQNGVPPQLNLFLYQVEQNAGWRNRDFPSRDDRGARTSNPMLPLDLYYLVTAYGSEALHAEILLGHAALLLHEVPVLTRNTIDKVLTGLPAEAFFDALRDSGLQDQLEMIKIAPQPMSVDETSKLWSALQSHYRPSIAYHVSVVLIESERPARTPLPVLERVFGVMPSLVPPYPALDAVSPPDEQPSVRVGEKLRLQGHDLAGTAVEVRLAQRETVHVVVPDSVAAAEVTITVPAIPAGHYTASVRTTKSGTVRTTNELPFALAPAMKVQGGSIDATVAPGPDDSLEITINEITPTVQPGQKAVLLVGDRESALTVPGNAPQSSLTFPFAKAVKPAAGTHWVRLRVDGVESLLIRRVPPPPAFDDTQKLAIP